MSDNLDRFIEIAKKTGDTLIIHDSRTEESMVVLPLEEYEMLVDNMQEEGFFDFDGMEDEDGELDFEQEMPWHSTAQVLEEQYDKQSASVFEREKIPVDKKTANHTNGKTKRQNNEQKGDITMEELDQASWEGSVSPANRSFPCNEQNFDEIESNNWEEEPLPDEEPIFLEEPIN